MPISNNIDNDQKSQNRVNGDLLHTIDLFKRYLASQKKNDHVYLNLSRSSVSLMDSWGKSRHSKQAQSGSHFSFEGSKEADVFIIDGQGSFFKTESGDLLIKILKAMNLTPESVFICNAGHIHALNKILLTRSPKVIITLGTRASQLLSLSKKTIHKIRGNLFEYQGIQVMPTYHPSRLLEKPELKRQVWEDMKKVMACIGQANGS